MRRAVGLALGVVLSTAITTPAFAARAAAGVQHSVVIASDGTVWTWGGNGNGQLGDGTITARKTPVQIPGLSGVTAVAAGGYHTLALTADGIVWVWGANGDGQLGDGTTTQRLTPITIGLSSIVAIAAGDGHSAALDSTGLIWVWGRNSSGQLGDGTTTRRTAPQVVTGLSGSAIAAGYSHTLAVGTDGTVWSWGANGNGQLGDGTTTQRLAPVQMSGVSTGLAAAAGQAHSLVLRTDRSVIATGQNLYGQLGDGTWTQRMAPVVVSSLGNVAALTASYYQSGAVLLDGTARVWGYNGAGALGDGSTTNRAAPIQPTGVSGLGALALGQSHSVAVTVTGIVLTWGANGYGQLGDGTTLGRLVPAAISEADFDWLVGTPIFSIPSGTYYANQTVLVTDDTAGAEIHYTLTGDDPDLASPTVASGGSVLVDRTATLKARAYMPGRPPSRIARQDYTLAAWAPTFSPGGGTYTVSPTVSLSTTTVGATIRYTTDGTNPGETSPIYTTPLLIGTTTTVKAAAFKTGWSTSAIASATYTLNFGKLAPPTLSPGAGGYAGGVTVILGSPVVGATVRYTTNGTTPTTSSPAYVEPLPLGATTTITARAFHPDYTASDAASATYTVSVAAPVFDPPAGSYLPGQTISITALPAGAVIHYTLDGSDPLESDPVYTPGVPLVVANVTVKARAWKAGCDPSPTSTASYTVTAATATASLDAGTSHSLALRADGLVWAWGNNTYGQLGDGSTVHAALPVVAAGGTGATAVSAAGSHTVARRTDGSIATWGINAQGQLGDGTTVPRSGAVMVPGLVADAVSAGDSHTVALLPDGTLRAWGVNTDGRLGDGTSTNRSSPVPVQGLTGMVAISAGAGHTLALKGDGTVWAWGNNVVGQLGDGTTTSRSVAVQVAGLTGVTTIAAGGQHSLARTSDGRLWAWGDNTCGRLGDGTTTRRPSPVEIFLANTTRLAAGGAHSLALDASGTLWAWGCNTSGQLGDGTTTERWTPVPINVPTSWVAVAAGNSHSLGLDADGVVWTWGWNSYGQLGDGTSANRAVPAPISGTGMLWQPAAPTIAPPAGRYGAAQQATVGCTEAGLTVRYTLTGADPTETDPVVACGGTAAIEISATLKARAWKAGAPPSTVSSATYELKPAPPMIAPPPGLYTPGPTVTISTEVPGAVVHYTLDGTEPGPGSPIYAAPFSVGASATVKAVALHAGWTPSDSAATSYWVTEGTVATPAISPAGGTLMAPVVVRLTTATAGATLRYTLDGSDPEPLSPAYAVPLLLAASTTVKARAFRTGFSPSSTATATFTLDLAGAAATPAVSPAGGRFAVRQFVTVSGPAGAVLHYTTNGLDPTEADPVIASGGQVVVDRSLVLKVRAWAGGQEPSAVRRAPFLITGAVSAGELHTLALAADGTVFAWGWGFYGQIGNGAVSGSLTPVAVLSGATAIAAGYGHSLALKPNGTVWAWGWNVYGQLGDGTTTQRTAPVQVTGLSGVVAIAAGREHSLAVTADGRVWAWGRNVSGQLGDGTTVNRSTPVALSGVWGAAAVAAGGDFSLALAADGAEEGSVWAWGGNASGQLGEGSTLPRLLPVRVPVLPPATEIRAGNAWAMARAVDGTVWSWGANGYGQLGDGSTQPRQPEAIGALARVTTIGLGSWHGLAVGDDGLAWAWGHNDQGQVGNGGFQCSGTPCVVPARLAVTISTFGAGGGAQHSILLGADGRVRTTGGNAWGQLGTGGTAPSLVPVLVPNLVLVQNQWLVEDADDDGSPSWQELLAGTDPFVGDTNGDGLPDGAERTGPAGLAGDPDPDGDGVATILEMARGTDPWNADTDGDGTGDGTDAFPLDPARSAGPAPDPNDHTPPAITLTLPAGARRIGGRP